MTAPREHASRARRRAVGALLFTALVGYAAFIHHGVGPRPEGTATHWWQPRGFLFDWNATGWLLPSTLSAMVGFGLPALALAVATFTRVRSAVVRTLAAGCVLACLLFLFYGAAAPGVWRFFHWRGSAVMIVTALAVGAAATAPLLAASWLRQRWLLRFALYAPVFFLLIALERNATGTDAALAFNISPWPAVPVFGLEVAAMIVVGWLAVVALGLGVYARIRPERAAPRALRALGGAALGGQVLVGAWGAAAALGALPGFLPRPTAASALAASFVCAAALAVSLAATLGVGMDTERVRRRALCAAVGAALAGAPLLLGQALARADYAVTRSERAQVIIDGLLAFYEREGTYPDRLEELVAARDLAAIPKPRTGFAFLSDTEFEYQSFGTSYILEFSATRWIQCAYNPPWTDEDEELDGGEDGGSEARETQGVEDESSLAEAWSCPSTPPDLFG